VHAISPKGDEKPNWPFRASDSDGTAYAATTSPAIAADATVYIGTTKGVVHAISPDGAEKPKWPFQTGDAIFSSPAIGMDGTNFVGSNDSYIYVINADATLRCKLQTDLEEVESSAAIGPNGMVYIGGVDGRFYTITIEEIGMVQHRQKDFLKLNILFCSSGSWKKWIIRQDHANV